MKTQQETWGQSFETVLDAVWMALVWPFKLFAKPAVVERENDEEEVKGPPEKFGIYSNPVTASIFNAIMTLIICGALIVMFGHTGQDFIAGLIALVIGCILFITGFAYHPTENQTLGAITVWGRILLLGGRSVTVKGIVFLCNLPLVWITTIKVQGTWEERLYKLSVLSKDDVIVPVEVRIQARADRYEMHTFINNGTDHLSRWVSIEEETRGIIENKTKLVARKMAYIDIVNKSETMSTKMKAKILCQDDRGKTKLEKRAFNGKTFGIEISRCNVKTTLPEDIVNKISRRVEYDSDLEVAKSIMETVNANGDQMTLTEAIDQVNTMRRIRDGKDARFEIKTDGNVTAVAIPGSTFNMGSGGKK